VFLSEVRYSPGALQEQFRQSGGVTPCNGSNCMAKRIAHNAGGWSIVHGLFSQTSVLLKNWSRTPIRANKDRRGFATPG
jgi:hypothetical protein